MLQIIHKIVRGRAENDKTEVDLIYANVSLDDILLKSELDALTKQDPSIRVHYVLNNPPSGWIGGIGFVTAEMITVCFPTFLRRIRGSHIYHLLIEMAT